MRRWAFYLSVALLAFGILLFYPFKTTVVPTWKVRVIDDKGNICANKEVREMWIHSSLEDSIEGGGDERRFTDTDGYVEFPERTIRASVIHRVIGSALAFIGAIVAHGSYGTDGSLHTSGLKDVAWLSYKPSKPLPDKMIVHWCVYDGNQ